MNLHSIVSPYVAAVNPPVLAKISRSTGYATAGDGVRTPAYATPVDVWAQVQSLQYNDIVQLDGLNIQGERRAMYLEGNWDGLVRSDGTGGDLIALPDGTLWLVACVAENWADRSGWVKVLVTRQVA